MDRLVAHRPGPGPQRPARLPGRMTVLGLRAGQLIAWQLTAVAAVVALILRGPGTWALGAAALLGFCLTVPRWQHRWAYEWILTAWRFHRGPHTSLPAIQVAPVRVRSGAEAGVVHDGEGFAVIVAVTPKPGLAPVTELPVAKLAGLLESADSLLSAVQVVIHSDCAASDAAAGPAAAYRNLGYHRIPRSQSAWIALRHDPAASGYAAAGSPRDAHTSLVRALASRGQRAVELLGDLGLRGRLMDADSARDAAGRGLLAADPGRSPAAQAGGRPLHGWRYVHGSTRSHVTYALRQWPAAGIPALQQALATAPALAVTTAILVTRADTGPPGLTATVRLAIPPGSGEPEVAAAVTSAAVSCGARLDRLNGEHVAGVLATLPLGRGPATRARWSHWHPTGTAGSLAAVMPITAGGVVLGTDSGDHPVAVPLFAADAGTRVAIVGDPLLPRLLALRALGTGARLQVVTAQPDDWTRLRRQAGLSAECMAVVRPGTQPPSDGTRAAPWMIIDDTGSPAAAGSFPWQCVVTVPGDVTAAVGALSGLDAILLQRITPDGASAVAAALGLPAASVQPLQLVPAGSVAIAVPGSVRFARLVLDQAERAVLAESLRAG
jgi:type VII secretion protein EccE